MATSDAIRELLEPLLDAEGLELVDAQVGPGLVRVLVDRPGGIDLETVSHATQRVSEVLDEADPMPGRYTLEVSSPGIERPLRTPEHFARAVGSVVAIRTVAGFDGERRIEGHLRGADESAATVELRTGESVAVPYAAIDRARTVFEWDAAPKPSRPSRAKKSARQKQKKAPQP